MSHAREEGGANRALAMWFCNLNNIGISSYYTHANIRTLQKMAI